MKKTQVRTRTQKKRENPIEPAPHQIGDKRELGEYLASTHAYQQFTGRDVDDVFGMDLPDPPSSAMFLGVIPAIEYIAPRDMGSGQWSLFRHEFAPEDAPILLVHPNMRQLIIAGGNYRFTSRGIVDDSDAEHADVI